MPSMVQQIAALYTHSVILMTVLGRSSNITQPSIIAFSSVSDFQVRLPASDSNTSLLQLSVIIRDDLDCIAEANISAVSVLSDVSGITAMINTLQTSVDGLTSDPLVQLLSSGSQNAVSQILTSIAKELNLISHENVDAAVSSTFLAHPSPSSSSHPLVCLSRWHSSCDHLRFITRKRHAPTSEPCNIIE